VYSHLPSLLFYSFWDIFDCCLVPGDVEDYISRLDDFYAFVSQPTSLWRPVLHVFINASALLEPILDSVVIKNSFTIYMLLFRDMCCDILIILLYICVT
jgi:hypothetical protein